MTTPKYSRIPGPSVDVSGYALGAAALELGPAHVYDLTVATRALIDIRELLKRLSCDARENPLAPYINLKTDESFGPWEWMLEANGKACGSEGA